jgi:hypothetical protein
MSDRTPMNQAPLSTDDATGSWRGFASIVEYGHNIANIPYLCASVVPHMAAPGTDGDCAI